MTQMRAGRALGRWEPELRLELLESLSLVASWAVWGQQKVCYVEFSSHGWLCQAALLKTCPGEMVCFWPVVGACGRAVPSSCHWMERTQLRLSMCDLGCGLAFLWALAPPEPCCQSTKPASHAGLSCSEPTRSPSSPARGRLFWARQWLLGMSVQQRAQEPWNHTGLG